MGIIFNVRDHDLVQGQYSINWSFQVMSNRLNEELGHLILKHASLFFSNVVVILNGYHNFIAFTDQNFFELGNNVVFFINFCWDYGVRFQVSDEIEQVVNWIRLICRWFLQTIIQFYFNLAELIQYYLLYLFLEVWL